jgi:hypothetical protein
LHSSFIVTELVAHPKHFKKLFKPFVHVSAQKAGVFAPRAISRAWRSMALVDGSVRLRRKIRSRTMCAGPCRQLA